jgi:cellulose synthase/poly-beta-1,6-N-acetylglucosamine synthase-like glycosyltransferase
MSTFELCFLAVYFLTLVVLCFYGSHRYQIALAYRKHKDNPPTKPPELHEAFGDELPKVLVQLPVFNERFVVERLISRVCALHYPHSHLLIQVLDDSTDDSTEIAKAAVQSQKDKGMPIEYLHRTDRTGFKAGALEAGLKARPEYELVVIFDADFLPEADFLEKVIPYFVDPKVGMVQARWDHLNREDSLLTQAQAILLDGHFMIEHTARQRSGRFFNFNGTAGVWRRQSIEEAGGWHHDTITEDLDLSYRAQLKGWRFIFLNDVLAPAELPIEMNAFKNQQHRWAKGSIQVALKTLPKVLKSDESFKIKYEAFCHLTGNIAYVMMIILSLMHPFALHLRVNNGWQEALLIDLPFFLGATVSVCFFFGLSQLEVDPKNGWKRFRYLPAVLGIGIGLAVNNAKATIEALFGHQSPFVRTPKWSAGDQDGGSLRALTSSLYKGSRGLIPYLELAFGIYYAYAVVYCILNDMWLALPFMFLFGWGFLYTALLSFFQPILLKRKAERQAQESTKVTWSESS